MIRRNFLRTSLAGGTFSRTRTLAVSAQQSGGADSSQETKRYDYLLRGGHVIDPSQNMHGITDVAVSDGEIAAVGKNIHSNEAKQTLDFSGYYVTPGLIDIHVHIFYNLFVRPARSVVPDDHSFSSGVTALVDTGTSGADNYAGFLELLDKSHSRTRTKVFAFINISKTGMDSGEQDPLQFDVQKAVETAQRYPDTIVGFKTAHYWTSRDYDELHTPWASVNSLIEAGDKANLPVMIDFFPRPPQGNYPERSYRELILEKMRPGDIHTHCYARHIPVINENGRVNTDILKAQERGRIFDVGHGAGSFVFRNAVPAIDQGYIPNSISTDLHGANTNGPVVNLLNVMSKFLCLGLSLEDVIQRTTVNSARIIRHSELGTLRVGSSADIAVIKLSEGNFSYADTSAGKITGDKKLECFMTFLDGKIVYDPSGYSKPNWKDIPKSSSYWTNPSEQTW